MPQLLASASQSKSWQRPERKLRAHIYFYMTPADALPVGSTQLDAADSPVSFPFENTYARLPGRFYARLPLGERQGIAPEPAGASATTPRLIKLNEVLAARLGLDAQALAGSQGVAILAGTQVAVGSEPLAMAYAGHQFGNFVPQLGDGRACLLGEVVDQDGVRFDIQLKGSGPTPFSRRGDGKAALGPVLREYIVSEAMAALGVPSTRALAAVTTGEHVAREGWMPGAVLTRVAASHLRVGTFQYFAARGDTEGVRTLADYAIARHYPEAAEARQPHLALLAGVIARQARLLAQWMLLGFVHGVMNTDNMSISGETIDYGPCAFLEAYDPQTVFSSIDQQGRYAFGNQPAVALWNLTRLAEALLPALEQEVGSSEAALAAAKEALAGFEQHFTAAHAAGLQRKLGLAAQHAGDAQLAEDLLACMAANQADFTLTLRRLCDAAANPEQDATVRVLFAQPAAYDAWATRWRERLLAEAATPTERASAMRAVNPAYIPRNHRVEAALNAAIEYGDFRLFEELLDVGSRPYEERPGFERYAEPAAPDERVSATFCGT